MTTIESVEGTNLEVKRGSYLTENKEHEKEENIIGEANQESHLINFKATEDAHEELNNAKNDNNNNKDLENIIRSSEDMAMMKHDSFSGIGDRNLSFGDEKKMIKNRLHEINFNQKQNTNDENSKFNIPSESITTLANEINKKNQFPTETQRDSHHESNTNRILAESMKNANLIYRDEDSGFLKKNSEVSAGEQKDSIPEKKTNLSKIEEMLKNNSANKKKPQENLAELADKMMGMPVKNSFEILNDEPTRIKKDTSRDSLGNNKTRSFQQTLNNIYDHLDKTLENIEISEKTESEFHGDHVHNQVENQVENQPTEQKMIFNKKNDFYKKLGVPLEQIQTAPDPEMKNDSSLDFRREMWRQKMNNGQNRHPLNTDMGRQILERHSKKNDFNRISPTADLNNIQEVWETRSANNLPSHIPNLKLNSQFHNQNKHNPPLRLNSKLHQRISMKEFRNNHQRPISSQIRNGGPKSVDIAMSEQGGGNGRVYQRVLKQNQRRFSPNMGGMSYQNFETLSMPGIGFNQMKRPMTGSKPNLFQPNNHRFSPVHMNNNSQYHNHQPRFNRQASENLLGDKNISPRSTFESSMGMPHQYPNQFFLNPSYQQFEMNRQLPYRPFSANYPNQKLMNYQTPAFGIKNTKEDMENRLVNLIKKILVFTSKIESLKKKIYKQDQNFSSSALFREFSSMNDRISLEEFFLLFQAFGFTSSSIVIYRIMIFLSGYRLEWIERNENDLIRESIARKNNGGYLETEFMITNDGRLESIRNMAHIEGERAKNIQKQAPIIQNSNTIPSKYISFNDFRHLFEIANDFQSRPQLLSHSQNDLILKDMDFHIIRQIVMLVNRMLDDISIIVNSLQPYGSLEIFSYLLEFNEGIVPNKTHKQNKNVIDSMEFAIHNSNSKMMMNDFNKRKTFGIDSNIRQTMMKPGKNRLEQEKEVQVDGFKDLLTVESLEKFLDFHNIQYIKDDLTHVIATMGNEKGVLDLVSFDKFLMSPIWNL